MTFNIDNHTQFGRDRVRVQSCLKHIALNRDRDIIETILSFQTHYQQERFRSSHPNP